MERYKNLRGESGVVADEIDRDSIKVEFEDSRLYLYTYTSTGITKIEQMTALASSGKGLATFIVRHVREAYAKKAVLGGGWRCRCVRRLDILYMV